MKYLLCFAAFVCLTFAQCPSNPLPSGDTLIRVVYGGQDREFLVHVPSNYSNSKPLALVMAWHGMGDNTQNFARGTRFSDFSDQTSGYVVVYPVSPSDTFNAGVCCPPASLTGIDDYGFARYIVDHVSKVTCIDKNKVFTTGFSNGCMMSQGLACVAPDVFKKSACGSGVEVLPFDSCNKEFNKFNTSLSILEIHGFADALVPYYGNPVLRFMPVPENFEAQRVRNGCTGSKTTTFDEGRVFCEEYNNCNNGVVVEQCSVTRGTHVWYNLDEFYNTEYILKFFGIVSKDTKLSDEKMLSDLVSSAQTPEP